MSGRRSRKLREQLKNALRKERLGEALGHYEALQAIEPDEPRWPHRKGDLLQRLDRPLLAVTAYEQAVDLYVQRGFVARGAAMAKVIMGIAPDRVDVLERVNLDAARKLHRSTRSSVVTADESTAGAKRLADKAPPLVVDTSARDGVRVFSMPPAARSRRIKLDISELRKIDEELGR